MRFLRPVAAAVLALAGLAAGVAPARAQAGAGQEFSVTVDSVAVIGNQRVSRREIVERTRIEPGTTVRFPDIQAAVHRLFATGDYADVRVRISRGDPAILTFEVEERPYVFRYEFEGLEHLTPSAVRDTAGLPAEGPLSPAPVKRAMNTIRDRLASKGFPRATVDTSLVPMGGDLPGYRLVLRVDEGPRLGIAKIRFEGNQAFSDAELRGAMSTGEEGFLWFNGGGLRRERYRRDLTESLPNFYARHGYIDFAVVDDTVIVDPRTGKGIIEVEVREGPQYRLASFEVEGNTRFPAARIRSMYSTAQALEEGSEGSLPAFDRVGFESGAEEVRRMYRNSGYLRVALQPSVQKVPRPDTAEGPPLVRASWNIDEGEPSYIRTVRIVGNTRTHDRIIRDRLTIVPGDVYSQQRLINSIQRIQGMGFFERIPPQEAVNIQNREDGDVDITLRVKEKQTGNLNFGMSAAAVSGLAGFIGYEQPNLFGQAKTVEFRWLFGSRTNDVNLTYQDPAVFGSQYSTNLNLRRSRDQFRTFSVGTRRQTGGSVEIGRAVFDRWTRAFVGYSLFEDKTTDLNFGQADAGQTFLQTGTRSTASFRLVRDSRNSQLFPTRGSRNMFSVRHTGGVLGGDGDFSKFRLESEWFVPVTQIGGGLQSRPIQFTAGVSFTGGMVVGDNPFFRERFFLGGVQFGEQLRGYEEATVTPRGHVPRNATFSQLQRAGEAFFTSTAQFGVRLSSNLYLNTFVDAGNIWSRSTTFNPTDLMTGAGVGASLVTPFGPLGVDYAYGFDRRDVLGRPDPGWKLHFKFGRVF